MLVSVQLERRYTKRGDPHLLRQPDQPRTRRVRRRSRLAHVLRQVSQGGDARRSRHDCRHHPDAGATQPLRQSRAHAGAAQQLRAAADGRGRLHHPRAGGRSRAPSAGAAGPADTRPIDRALFRRGHPQGSRAASTAPTRSIRPACASRRRSTSICRKRPTPRSIAACASIDKRRNGFRRPARNIVAEGRTLETFTLERWSQPMLAGDIVPAPS